MNQHPPLNSSGKNDDRKIAQVVNGLLKGQANDLLDVTLTANAAVTTVTDQRLGVSSQLAFMARTAHAAAIKASIYVDGQTTGKALVHHTNTANTDQDFRAKISSG